MADSDDQFKKLEEKLSQVSEVFKRTQAEKRALEAGLEKSRLDSKERAREIDSLEKELVALRKEREEIRSRIEKLLHRIDVLTSPESEG